MRDNEADLKGKNAQGGTSSAHSQTIMSKTTAWTREAKEPTVKISAKNKVKKTPLKSALYAMKEKTS